MKTLNAVVAIVVAAVLFGALNLIAQESLRGARLDLTENKLYTLSQGSKEIARAIAEPIELELFYSEKLGTELPEYLDYAERVIEVLDGFERASGDGLRLAVVEPEPYSEAEERATRAGLQSVPVGRAGDPFFLGLVGRNAIGDTEVLPFLRADREEFLEYEIARMISTLDKVDRTTVGLLSTIPVEGQPAMMPGMPSQPGWLVVEQLRALFDVQTVDSATTEIDAEIDVLLLLHPRGLSDETLYAIDQFALDGGRVVAFVDPWCEAQPTDPNDPMAQFGGGSDRGSDLGPLLAAWGVELADGELAGDRASAMRVGVTGPNGQRSAVDYVLFADLGPDRMADDDPVTAQLTRVIAMTAGSLSAVPDASTTFEPLVRTSDESMLIPTARIQFAPDPNALLAEFESRDAPLTIAARVSGPISSAYPDGPPAAEGEQADAAAPQAAGLTESTEDFAAIVIADADLLEDRAWAQRDPFFGGVVAQANNLDLLLNAVEQLAGDEGLLSIRARTPFGRPFTLVEELRRDAEARYQAEELRLQDRLDEINRELSELQSATPDGNRLLLTDEQLDKIDEANIELAETRKELRQVRLELNREVEQLGATLTAINTGLVPLVWLGVGLGLWSIRRKTKRN
ncbi:MAG: Gldg family protein [Planctomycetota bacterium]